MKGFEHVDTWIFDLDNTLYDAEQGVFEVMRKHMTGYVARTLGVDLAEADRIRQHFYTQYGTTMQGLLVEHAIDPVHFLGEVHDTIDISLVPLCEASKAGLERLPGRRLIHTNAPRDFATRVIDRLGIGPLFDGVYTIEDAGYISKPDPRPYDDLLRRNGVDPRRAAMVEDSSINLRPAAARGMTTVWLHGGRDQDSEDHVHHRAERLPDWMQTLFPAE